MLRSTVESTGIYHRALWKVSKSVENAVYPAIQGLEGVFPGFNKIRFLPVDHWTVPSTPTPSVSDDDSDGRSEMGEFHNWLTRIERYAL
jgi:hypothetical protein